MNNFSTEMDNLKVFDIQAMEQDSLLDKRITT